VHVDGKAVRSWSPDEGRGRARDHDAPGAGHAGKAHPLQTAYIEEQVVQCGYCLNGWVMTAAAFLATHKKPTDDEIREALTGLNAAAARMWRSCAR